MNHALFSTSEIQYETPKNLYDYLNKIFHFQLDPCARDNIESQKRIDTAIKYTVEDDGLSKSWENLSTFVNPPYHKIKRWIDKCITEYDSRKHPRSPLVLLVPARTDTTWFHKIVNHPFARVFFLKGRLRFANTKTSAPFPSCLIMLTSSSYLEKIPQTASALVPTWTLDLKCL